MVLPAGFDFFGGGVFEFADDFGDLVGVVFAEVSLARVAEDFGEAMGWEIAQLPWPAAPLDGGFADFVWKVGAV